MRRILLLAALALAIPSSTVASPSTAPGRLVFSGGPQGDQHLFAIQADGTSTTDLTADYPRAWELGRAVWSPDGTKIAYAQYENFGRADIYSLDLAAGSTRRRLTTSFKDEVPVWSPDGQRVAFVRTRQDGSTALYVTNGDGSDLHLVAQGARPELGLDWSVDGEIAYSTDDEIRVVRPDGSGGRSLGAGWGPSWSPDGARIAFFVRQALFDRSRLYVENSDGSGRREISSRGVPDWWAAGRPSWSPDGRQIAFAGLTETFGLTELFAVEVGGTGERRLTRGQVFGYRDPSWSPDGQKVGFTGSGSGGWSVGVVNADGTCELHLHEGRWPSWQPDSGGTPTTCANLAVSGGSSPQAVRLGRRFTYQVRVSNLGEMTATNVRVVGKLTGKARPVSISRNAGPGSCDISGTQFECVFDRIPVDGTVLIRAKLQALGVGPLSASVEGTANEVDPNRNDNKAVLSAHVYNCSILGTEEDDALRGTPRRDVICSLGGNDTLRSMAGRDAVSAGPGDDLVSAGRGDDTVSGGSGDDVLNPGPGGDTVWGGVGDDYIDTVDGYRDVVDCGSGVDRVLADSRDRVSNNCERLGRRRAR